MSEQARLSLPGLGEITVLKNFLGDIFGRLTDTHTLTYSQIHPHTNTHTDTHTHAFLTETGGTFPDCGAAL